MAVLDRSSDEYKLVAGLIESAYRQVCAAESRRWNGEIGLLAGLKRSRSDVDGTIHLHQRAVIGALMRTQAPRWYGLAARDAAYNVVYEALRQASDSESSRTGELLDGALPPATRSLDDALALRRTYEITEAVLADNGMAHVYSTEAPDRLRGGRTPRSTAGAEAARGLVDGLAAVSTQSRDEVFDSLLNHPKPRRWDLAFAMVARKHGPALGAKLASEPHRFTEVSKRADIEWGRLDSGWPRPGFEDAPDFGYAVGRNTAKLLTRSASYLAEQAARTVSRELTPQEVLGGQAPFTSVQAPASPPDASTAPGQSQGTERKKPQER